MKHVLVIGTGWTTPARRAMAARVGGALADAGFGLVCGDSTGVDRHVADAYCATRAAAGAPLPGAFMQVALGLHRPFARGGAPWPGFHAPDGCRIRVGDVEAWKRTAVARCDAALMIGGGAGALDIARRVIAAGRPALPLPFTGGMTGNADEAYRQILMTWDTYPVPGVTRSQYLRLCEPWVVGTGPLLNLLRGTLADRPDVFISYRRSDAPAAAGRIASDLAEHFGTRRVFLDIHGIAPSKAWSRTIDDALQACRAGIVVIGRNWLQPAMPGGPPRLHAPGDVLRGEVAQLLRTGKAVFPLLVEGARLPDASELPDELQALVRFQGAAIDNGDWETTSTLLVRQVEAVLRDVPQPAEPSAPSPAASPDRQPARPAA